MSDDTPTQIVEGDCIEEMQAMDENSVHAVVTDPPYGLAFMGRSWDDFEPKEYQQWCEEWATEALRVLKPGGHLIAFSGNRTHHRLFSAVEDAGFTVRDTITYHYGVGFPKGSDVSKHIDRYYDAEDDREVVGESPHSADRTERDATALNCADDGSLSDEGRRHITLPATSEAEKWDGFRTQLKPASEFAVLARAPMSESAVYRNVLEWGTGALNIDRTRIPTDEKIQNTAGDELPHTGDEGLYEKGAGRQYRDGANEGRYPANLLLDGVAAAMLDSQSGELDPGGYPSNSNSSRTKNDYGEYANADIEARDERINTESGGASRFFYTAKASKSERTIDGQIDNEHPTVKPLDLCEWLVTLVTAPGQRVLDPFAGSGTTIMACKRLNREGIGIEKDEEHAELARKRVELAHEIETDTDLNTPDKLREADYGEFVRRKKEAGEWDGADDEDAHTTLESFGDDD